MPWNDPNGIFRSIYEFFMSPEMQALLAALILAVLRIMSDRNNGSVFSRANVIECLLCVSVTWVGYKVVPIMGLDPNFGVIIGGIIGFFGTKWLEKKVDIWAEARARKLGGQ